VKLLRRLRIERISRFDGWGPFIRGEEGRLVGFTIRWDERPPADWGE
jgi:hypothetical protein